jgi:lipoprotein-anchoring transpeptidase ErfK/SrfK
MSRHRRDVRPRYGRIAVLATSVTVTAVTALAGVGVLATTPPTAGAQARPASYTTPAMPDTRTTTGADGTDQTSAQGSQGDQGTDRGTDQGTDRSTDQSTDQSDGPGGAATSPHGISTSSAATQTALPADSGSGRRIVYSQPLQRVWLVSNSADEVKRTYLVSGSIYDNLQPGAYSVYSRSRWAVGVDDSGVMQYFVRFTRGPTGAAIGFHSIPTKDGKLLQSTAQLGTAQSHGCIRQWLPDAVALWHFAPVGTKVVVV